ncbi:GxxExxY protein [Robertkochia sediminum]|uniref:GxxExxY protein n=1 Tax=Robertkochia sediminum TaxID=2785326 RepID=UPI001932CC7E|nr:GxxExxY protein [Robertkochia sediminum]MBL7473756.1 GxxExxY protein [Robertkochia sediminum]
MSLKYEKETYKIIGACMTVHKEIGSGFTEGAYQEALEMELEEQNIPFEAQVRLPIMYKGKKLRKYFVADLLCYDKIIVELKSSNFLHKSGSDQLVNYLKATNHEVGLLINFGESSLKWKRFINSVN